MTKLQAKLEKLISKKIVNKDNCTQFYLEGIKVRDQYFHNVQFKSDIIAKACEALISQNFDLVAKTGSKFLQDLPVEYFTSLCKADNLQIKEEKVVVDLIEAYLKRREDLPLLDEENPLMDWSSLTSAEKALREEQKKKQAEEEGKIKEEEKKKKEEEFKVLEKLPKIQYTWNELVQVSHKEAEGRLHVNRLTKAQKKNLFSSIRYSYLHHQELLALTTNKNFKDATELIVEGLSVRLDSYENAMKKDLVINIEPRVNFEIHDEKPSKPASSGQGLGGLLAGMKSAAATENKSALQQQLMAKKPYANYYERKLDEAE